MTPRPQATPGPWMMVRCTRTVRLTNPVEVRALGSLCYMAGNTTDEANGRLMAAAPTMLAALKGCIHHDNALLAAYQIPASLRRQIEQAIAAAKS